METIISQYENVKIYFVGQDLYLKIGDSVVDIYGFYDLEETLTNLQKVLEDIEDKLPAVHREYNDRVNGRSAPPIPPLILEDIKRRRAEAEAEEKKKLEPVK